MKALVVTRRGGPEVLAVREVPEPTPGPGQVRLRVAAAGLNFADVMARKGLYPDAPPLPTVLGYEAAGVIDAVGPDVTELRVGQRATALCRFGAQAEAVVVPAGQAVPLPDHLSFELGAALPVAYLTAHHMLFTVARLRPGSRVLVRMAAGGVGQAALQLLRTVSDVEVIGTASAGKHPTLRALGCHHVIDPYRESVEARVRELTGGRGVELVLDAVGGPSWAESYRLLRPAGLLIVFGMASLSTGPRRNLLRVLWTVWRLRAFSALSLMNHNRAVAGVNLGHLWDEPELMLPQLRRVVALAGEGVLTPAVHGAYPFSRAADAHRDLEGGATSGKLVLLP